MSTPHRHDPDYSGKNPINRRSRDYGEKHMEGEGYAPRKVSDVRTGPFARAMERGAAKHLAKSKALRRKLHPFPGQDESKPNRLVTKHYVFNKGGKERHMGMM